MQQVLDFFIFETCEIVVLALLAIIFIIQLYYYLTYYRIPYLTGMKESLSTTSEQKVSVIIASENEGERLSRILPAILEQDYSDYEVIVINDGSTDETEYILDEFKVKYDNLYSTFLPYSNDKKFGKRKLAYTIGIKASKGDVLLFVEPQSCPVSKDWISHMVSKIDDQIEVVLGVSYFKKNKTSFNRLARFDNHLFTMQYVYRVLKGKPFTGVYRNVAFKKELFFANKGFASYLALENGEELFINQIVDKKKKNTAVALLQDSFTETDVDNFALWKKIKKNYSLCTTFFKNISKLSLSFEPFTRLLFYVLTVGIIVWAAMTSNHLGMLIIASLLFLIRFITQLIIINKGSKYFKSGRFYCSLILLDILQPLYNLRFRTRIHKIK